ncbi:MAG TPA: hypothetical protein VMT30_09250 [Candidatus Saccharimonadia bacterium]|nr:hypothetical protein [Candidatus Saccharimonadia bacterium]
MTLYDTMAPVIVQRRDNWSRETVRSLRRKVRNLKAELSRQAMGTPYGQGRLGKWRQQAVVALARVTRLEAATIRQAEELAWYRHRLETIADLASMHLEQPDRWGGLTHGLLGIRDMARHTLEQPLFPLKKLPATVIEHAAQGPGEG